ncbi:MarR family winged helix-turn-helix transcriptional regulator [Nonomuraea sp. WAC 01424]|uniref:MarR family winged helix-turn-helix transcriptional regulator n=1 Tax=Nonomuraea sp. WAC 01424 TaxID=2203200 RepID=UPI0021ADBCB2|nr:MarR family transcriptional regulator [Nonomuraea sp. WAC 01424]
MTGKSDSYVAEIEAAVVGIRRSQRRRTLARLSERRGEAVGQHAELRDAVYELLDVIEAAEANGDALTVTDAAAILDVDQPRSSRLAGQALRAGLLRREADQLDGRRSLLALTTDGRAVLARIRDFRRAVIAEVTAEWTEEERAAFACLLNRFVRDFATRTRS